MFRGNYSLWRRYMKPEFHPRKQDDSLSVQWLQANANEYTPVGQSA
jgi:predicted metal-dependent hydrolase